MKKDSPDKKELTGWAYVRVSTADQSNVLHGSLEQQQNRIKRWEADQSLHTGVTHRITRFIDEDISGRSESLHKRREYHELTLAIKQRIIDFVVIEKLDRLHRNIVESRKFIDLCDEMGVKFYRLDGGLVDLRDRSSRTSVFIESWMAEEYSLDLVEKLTKKGREARVNNGKDNNSLPILGLDEHPTEACFYVINKREQEIVKDIFRHFCRCADLQQTANYCNTKGYKTKERYTRPKVEKGKKVPPKLVGGEAFDRKNLRALLVNRKIAGFGFFKDDWNQFPAKQDEKGMVRWEYRHGPVIDGDLFEKAQVVLRKNAKFNHRIYDDQRIYLLSGILFDRDGNKFCGQSVKKKKNPYYINSEKKIRIRAERIEKAVIDFLSSLLRKNGLLEDAVKKTFNGDNPVLNELNDQLARNTRELQQCERVISVLVDKSRIRILEQPERMEEILLESSEIRKQSMARMDELRVQAAELGRQKEQIDRFKKCDDVQNNIKKSLKLFETSSSKRKKRLIEMLVPKAVLDEKRDQLFLFINPFLENSQNSVQESIAEVEAFLPQKLIQSNSDSIAQMPETYCEILSHGGKKVCIAEDWRGNAKLCKLIFIHPVYQGFTPLYVVPLFRNKILIQQKYVVEGLSAKQIAREILCSKMAVLDALTKFRIPIRESHYHHGHPSQPRYGKKYRKDLLVDHKVEQRVIEVVSKLRANGLSLRQIAQVLSDMKVSTKCRGRAWHPEMVRRILEADEFTDN